MPTSTLYQARPDCLTPESHNSPTWLVDQVVGSVRRGKRGELFYRVRWEDTWEPAECLQGGADTAIAEYFRLNPSALGQDDNRAAC